MPDLDNKHQQRAVLDFVDDSKVTHSDAPPALGADQPAAARRTRVERQCIHAGGDPLTDWGIESAELAQGARRERNGVGRHGKAIIIRPTVRPNFGRKKDPLETEAALHVFPGDRLFSVPDHLVDGLLSGSHISLVLQTLDVFEGQLGVGRRRGLFRWLAHQGILPLTVYLPRRLTRQKLGVCLGCGSLGEALPPPDG